MQELVGTWELVGLEYQDGREDALWSTPTSCGWFIFTSDGSASVGMNQRIPAGAEDGMLFYCGPYTVENDAALEKPVLALSVVSASRPELIGTVQRRVITLTGDQLTLATNRAEVRWRRRQAAVRS